MRPWVAVLVGLGSVAGAWPVAAQSDPQALFEQAFGKRRNRAVQTIALPTTLDGREVGIVDAEVSPSSLRLARGPLADALAQVLEPSLLKTLRESGESPWITAQALAELGVEARYSAQRIAVDLVVPLRLRRVQVVGLGHRGADDARQESGEVLPAPWSVLANWRWTMSGQSGEGQTVRRSQLFGEAAVRLGDWVFETNGSVATSGAGGTQRYATRAVRDWPDAALRLSLGDVAGAARPGVPAVAVAGVRLAHSYGLTPGFNSQSQPAQALELPRGASVDIVVNGFVVRTLRLGPGVYNLRDIPVFSGANDVLVRALEPGGRSVEQQITYFFDAGLLAKGLSEWDVVWGVPSATGPGGRAYLSGQTAGSMWWRRGWTAHVTGGLGMQWQHKPTGLARLWAADFAWAAPVGTVAGWVGESMQTWGRARAASLQWRAATPARIDADWAGSVSLQLQRSGQGYAAPASDVPGSAATEVGVRASVIWGEGWGASMSVARRASAQLGQASVVQSLGLRRNLSRNWSFELALQREQRSQAAGSRSAALTLRYGGEPSPDGTVFRGVAGYQSDLQRTGFEADLSGVTTVAGGEAPWRISGRTAQGAQAAETQLQGQLFTGRGELTWAATESRQLGAHNLQHELTLASAVVVGPAGVFVAAPVADSAAVLVPRRGMDGLKLYVDPQRQRAAASSDILGAPVLSDLVAYSPRVIQLDAENLPPGRSLGVDRPLLKPTYRSLLQVPVGSDAITQVKGQLLAADGQPLALQAVRLMALDGSKSVLELFTNRRGGFTSPSLSPGRYVLVRPGEAAILARVAIGVADSGVVVLPPIVLEAVK